MQYYINIAAASGASALQSSPLCSTRISCTAISRRALRVRIRVQDAGAHNKSQQTKPNLLHVLKITGSTSCPGYGEWLTLLVHASIGKIYYHKTSVCVPVKVWSPHRSYMYGEWQSDCLLLISIVSLWKQWYYWCLSGQKPLSLSDSQKAASFVYSNLFCDWS